MFLFVVIVTMGISFLAMARVKSAIAKYSQVSTRSGLTGAQTAQRILAMAGIHDVEIVGKDGMMGDHYDPIHKRLVLSRQNFYGNSVAALGIAAHEAGHAIQHKKAYKPLEWRMAAVGITNFASPLCGWLPILGATFGLVPWGMALMAMAIGWGIMMVFNLITLPVEFDATRRAKVILTQTGMIAEGEEADGMNRVLNAAGWTYVAAFITSLSYFLMYLLPLLTGRSD